MIITSRVKLDVGRTYTEKDLIYPFEANGQLYYTYNFYVIAETSEVKYINYLVNKYGTSEPFESLGHYYVISID